MRKIKEYKKTWDISMYQWLYLEHVLLFHMMQLNPLEVHIFLLFSVDNLQENEILFWLKDSLSLVSFNKHVIPFSPQLYPINNILIHIFQQNTYKTKKLDSIYISSMLGYIMSWFIFYLYKIGQTLWLKFERDYHKKSCWFHEKRQDEVII